MADVMGLWKSYPQKWSLGGEKINWTNNIFSIVMNLANYLDNTIKIIFQQFQTLVTSITRKLILDSRKTLF